MSDFWYLFLFNQETNGLHLEWNGIMQNKSGITISDTTDSGGVKVIWLGKNEFAEHKEEIAHLYDLDAQNIHVGLGSEAYREEGIIGQRMDER